MRATLPGDTELGQGTLCRDWTQGEYVETIFTYILEPDLPKRLTSVNAELDVMTDNFSPWTVQRLKRQHAICCAYIEGDATFQGPREADVTRVEAFASIPGLSTG